MARLALQSHAAPAAQGPVESKLQDLALLTLVCAAFLAALNPGVLLGAGIAALWRWQAHPSQARRLAAATIAAAVPLLALHSWIVWAWPWLGLLAQWFPAQFSTAAMAAIARSILAEALAGPLVLEVTATAITVRRRSVTAQVRQDHRLDQRRWQAITERDQSSWSLAPAPPRLSTEHPSRRIRIGYDLETGSALDLILPDDLAAHIFLLGLSGSGKTTTIIRLAGGALASGYSVIIVDCKAGGLGHTTRALAAQYGVPFFLVDPDDPDSLGYNPCAGDAAAVANKLVGTFSFGPNAEIYKNISMESVAVAVRGLHAAGEPVTLHSLYRTFAPEGFAALAQHIPAGDPVRERLLALQPSKADRTGAAGVAGLQHRLGALLEGRFGWLFAAARVLDWNEATAQPSATYVALSALASSEDVDLMGRVVVQDLKQLCAQRLRARAAGRQLQPLLVVLDEFAALDEPDQILDLLRQAREALVTIVVSTQHTPDTPALRKACFGAGLLIVHRVEAEDSELAAAQFGTHRATEVTNQVDYETGFSEQGTIRRVPKYNVSPDEFRSFTAGQAALKSVASGRYAIVRVFREGTP